MLSDIDVLVSEVGPRDGLQNTKAFMPTEYKKKWISAAAAAGLREIEVCSFVPPKLIPQMVDAAEVVAHALTIPDLHVAVLAPNYKGAERAMQAGAHKITQTISVSKLGGAHLHNTRGLGLANVVAGLDVGVRTFDSSLGGLGGCPFAPGATGNIVTEDLVFMLEAMGLKTGVDLDQLLAVREIVAAGIPGEALYGYVPAAGITKGFVPATARNN